jgi:hypothetical protein
LFCAAFAHRRLRLRRWNQPNSLRQSPLAKFRDIEPRESAAGGAAAEISRRSSSPSNGRGWGGVSFCWKAAAAAAAPAATALVVKFAREGMQTDIRREAAVYEYLGRVHQRAAGDRRTTVAWPRLSVPGLNVVCQVLATMTMLRKRKNLCPSSF